MKYEIPKKMIGMKLPGGAKVQKVEQPVPVPGPGQVLLKMKAASLCGSDLKYIYYEHTDKTGGARYDDVIAGHEPSGQVYRLEKTCWTLKKETVWLYITFRDADTVTSVRKASSLTARIRRDVLTDGRETVHLRNIW